MFEAFPKIARLNREIVITEKIDGTNAQILIAPESELPPYDASDKPLFLSQQDGLVLMAGSRSKWISPGKQTDNYGFARWAQENAKYLFHLGPGRHYGEWWGGGIQRGYGLQGSDKRFSLFNVSRWNLDNTPYPIVNVVPTLYRGPYSSDAIDNTLAKLRIFGSQAVENYMKPEGIVIYHVAADKLFKVTLENDAEPKGKAA